MNYYEIEDINFFNQTACKMSVSVCSYDLNESCSLIYKLFDVDGNYLFEGIYYVPSDVLGNWNDDNYVLIESLCESKGIKLKN